MGSSPGGSLPDNEAAKILHGRPVVIENVKGQLEIGRLVSVKNKNTNEVWAFIVAADGTLVRPNPEDNFNSPTVHKVLTYAQLHSALKVAIEVHQFFCDAMFFRIYYPNAYGNYVACVAPRCRTECSLVEPRHGFGWLFIRHENPAVGDSFINFVCVGKELAISSAV